MSSQPKTSTVDCSKRSVPGGCLIRLCFQLVVAAFLLHGGVLIFGNLSWKQIHNLTIVKIHFYTILNVRIFFGFALFLPVPPISNRNNHLGHWSTLWFLLLYWLLHGHVELISPFVELFALLVSLNHA